MKVSRRRIEDAVLALPLPWVCGELVSETHNLRIALVTGDLSIMGFTSPVTNRDVLPKTQSKKDSSSSSKIINRMAWNLWLITVGLTKSEKEYSISYAEMVHLMNKFKLSVLITIICVHTKVHR